MNKKSIGLLLSILGVLSLVLITAGVTYAFFNYAKEGSTENSITTGKITFIYEEVEAQGAGISIHDAYPISDTEGKAQIGSGKVFNFTVKSQTMNNASIPYVVTARMKAGSTLDQSVVKVYLTEVNGTNETELLLDTYDSLIQTSVDVPEGTVEKVIYIDTVLAGSSNYEKDFRLRIWIPDTIDFSPIKDESGNDVYPYNGKTFALTVNVYANATVVTDSETTTSLLLRDEIMKNTLIEAEPTLTTSSNNTSDASGLYKSTATNSGNPTYYFRGEVENNYVSFAEQTWRVVRINEDGTIRMIMANGINDDITYKFNSSYNSYTYMYYTNSNAKTQLESWYETNIASNENYVGKVATGDYFCEQAKVKSTSSWTSGSAEMELSESYTPDFKCATDGNGYGIVNSNIGLITCDEVVYAGGYYYQDNSNYYLYNTGSWTMSPAGVINSNATAWLVYSSGGVSSSYSVRSTNRLRAVINLNADTAVTGSGTSTDPWIVV